jgi:ribosomal protein L6P/L9E
MNPPDVQVTVEGGVADVQVNRPGITVEVRDYDVDAEDDDHELVWTDENGDRCMHYFAVLDETTACEQPPAEQPTTSALGS